MRALYLDSLYIVPLLSSFVAHPGGRGGGYVTFLNPHPNWPVALTNNTQKYVISKPWTKELGFVCYFILTLYYFPYLEMNYHRKCFCFSTISINKKKYIIYYEWINVLFLSSPFPLEMLDHPLSERPFENSYLEIFVCHWGYWLFWHLGGERQRGWCKWLALGRREVSFPFFFSKGRCKLLINLMKVIIDLEWNTTKLESWNRRDEEPLETEKKYL